MNIKLYNGGSLEVPSDPLEYAALVDLHDTLGIHEPIDHGYRQQCAKCGAFIQNYDGDRYESMLAGHDGFYNDSTLEPSNRLLMPSVIERNHRLIMSFAGSFGPSETLRARVLTLSTSGMESHTMAQYVGRYFPISDKTETILMACEYRNSSCYGRRLRDWKDAIHENAKKTRKTLLDRNKEIWQTLKGHRGSERQALIDELEEGIRRRKLLKAKENWARDKWTRLKNVL